MLPEVLWRPRARAFDADRRTRTDVLFVALFAVLITVHATVFFATLVIAPVTAEEQQSLTLLHLPVEVARALTLPFTALLLVSLYVLGARIAGRWAGMAAVFAVLALNLRADQPLTVIYGPSVATGGWIAAALLAAALVLVPRHRAAAAAVLGAATLADGLIVLALPAFLIALALFPAPRGLARRARLTDIATTTGVFLVPAVLGQLLWLVDLGPAGYADRAQLLLAEFTPHPLVGWLQQQAITFSAWHLPLAVTVGLVVFLFLAAGTGVVRYFAVPRPEEHGAPLTVIARRLPVELWAAGLTLLLFSIWWAFSGDLAVVGPNLPVLVAVVPLITALAYRGAKWLLTVNRFWAFAAVVYLIGLVGARSVQAVLTLVQAFQR
ncbi:hypothetical protein [uncultured Amnibacterium sp.]|uniref:hypothetical protein n=1 Tax=uncultured Amnibacterium sp. TaxID=1631851 RepID=UPI0035C954E8